MPARITPSRGGKPDKLIRDALMIELATEISFIDPTNASSRAIKIKKLRAMCMAWVNAAINGDIQACEKIADRVDGKSLVISGPNEGPIEMELTGIAGLLKEIDRESRERK